jgi:CheY-like chemotaxis protein
MDNVVLDIGYERPTKKTILVVDDEIALQSVMFDTFSDEFTLISASNGREGLTKAEHAKPDVILLDVMMPDMNGVEVLQHLRANDDTKNIPVIVSTAKGFDAGMIEMLKHEPNVAGYLAKPFHVKEIRNAVRLALQKSGSQ